MKKIFIIISLIVLVFSFSSCKINNEKIETNEQFHINNENSSQSYDSIEPLTKTVGVASYAEPESMEKIIEKSYSIVEGTLTNVESDKEISNLKYYTFKVVKCIKGNLDNMSSVKVTIFDFEAYPNSSIKKYEHGDKFLLPLIKIQDIYEGDSFQLAGSMLILLDKENKIKDIYHQSEIYKKSKPSNIELFKPLISKAVRNANNNGKARGASYTKSNSIKEIVDFSQTIVKAKIKDGSIYKWNEKLCSYELEIIAVLKGDVPKKMAVYALLEDNLVMGNEYLMLLSEPEYKELEAYSFSSYHSCIPLSDIKTYEEYMKYIDKKQ